MCNQFSDLSAVAAAAVGAVAAEAVACRIENEKGYDDEPDDLVIEKVAKTVHFVLRRQCRRGPFV